MTEEKPRVFVASSKEKKEIAKAIAANLEDCAYAEPWCYGTFLPSHYPLESLLKMLDKVSFGVFVLSAEDTIKVDEQQYPVTRQNVVFELGMFMGRHGRERAMIVMPKESSLKWLSDVLGITVTSYDPEWPEQNWRAALNAACMSIKEVLCSLPTTAEAGNGQGMHCPHCGIPVIPNVPPGHVLLTIDRDRSDGHAILNQACCCPTCEKTYYAHTKLSKS